MNATNTEVVEIKKVYKHPLYKYPHTYNDVAVLELGRRIEYDFARFGDSPTCIDQGLEKVGKLATVQGYGSTEKGVKGSLTETQVTVISNNRCSEIMRANISTSQSVRERLVGSLPLGLNYGLMCGQGLYNPETSQFSDACKGDSGGPLFQKSPENWTTLIGIVSGGIDCYKGVPGWYTRVESFTTWIRCIVDQSVNFGNEYKKVTDACRPVVQEAPRCDDVLNDPEEALFDLRGLNVKDVCAGF